MNSKQQDKNKQFLNKKRMFIIAFSLCILIVLIIITFVTILNIDIKSLWNDIVSAFKENVGISVCLLLILCSYSIVKTWGNVYTLTIRLKAEGIKVKFGEQCIHGLTICFLSAVTPANFITDPYTIFWLKTQGLKTYKASAQVLVSDFIWHIGQLLITWPSFIIILIGHYRDIVVDAHGYLIFW
jgi:uncharacterized membrane protein YbhN (UPF0104 family)